MPLHDRPPVGRRNPRASARLGIPSKYRAVPRPTARPYPVGRKLLISTIRAVCRTGSSTGLVPAGRIMPPLRERTPLSSLTAEAKPTGIAPFGNGLELRQAAKRPFPIVRIKARSRQIIVTQPHYGPSAARLKQKFDRRLPRRDADDATPGINDFAIGHDLDVVTFDLHSAGLRQAKDATGNGIGIDDLSLPFLYLRRIG